MHQTSAPAQSTLRAPARRWPMERVLFGMAGTVTLTGTALAAFVSPGFLAIPAFAAINQLAFVKFGACPASLILARLGFEQASCAR